VTTARPRIRVLFVGGLVLALALVVWFVVSVAAASPATVSVGMASLVSSSPNVDSFALDVPVFQGDASGNYVLGSPVTGAITSWSFLSGGVTHGNMFVLRVLAPDDMVGTSWTAVGTSAPEAVASATGTDAVQGPFVTSLAIQAGDRIALEPETDGSMPIETGVISQDGIRYFTAPFADDATANIDGQSNSDAGQIVPIQASVAPVAVNSALPVVSGSFAVGQTVSCSTGTWTNAPTSYAYQWYANGAPLTGETAATHTIGLGETGEQLTCQVTATTAGGTASATSTASTPVTSAAAAAPLNTALPSISGTAQEFLTLETSPGLWTGGVNSFAYQWLRCATASGDQCAPISGATTTSYVLTLADVGSTIRVQVTAANTQGSTITESLPTAVVKLGVLTANLSIVPQPACTGIGVRVDSSTSVSPNGIKSYTISEISLAPSAEELEAVAYPGGVVTAGGFVDEEGYENFTAGNGYNLTVAVSGNPQNELSGALAWSDLEIEQRTIATFNKPTVDLTFDWNRTTYPYLPPIQPHTAFARDPVGIILTVTDYAGTTASVAGIVSFAQQTSDASRALCPAQAQFVTSLARTGLLSKVVPLVFPSGNTANKANLSATLTCTQKVACTGDIVVAVSARAKIASAAAARRSAPAPTVVARSFFAIAAGHRKRITAKLTPSGLRLLRRLHHGASEHAQITVTNVSPTGKTLTRTSSTVLKRK
jgi:hypothetical protein